jgi:SWIM zinc finger
VPITISADDPRSIRAIEIAATAGQWLRCRTDQGEAAYRIPSQSRRNRYYLVTHASCDCADFQRRTADGMSRGEPDDDHACKHVLALRLHDELVKAVQRQPRLSTPRSRGHLWLVSANERAD